MKLTKKSLKRTNQIRLNSLLLSLAILLLFSLPSCQKGETELNTLAMENIELFSYSVLDNSPVIYYGPQRFDAVENAVSVRTVSLQNPNYKYFDGNFLLKVINGNNSRTKVTRFEIRINGVLEFTKSDFPPKQSYGYVRISNLTPESVLEATITGPVGSFITVFIYGNIRDGVISDVDGNYYNPVVIGSQTWLQENLKTSKYNDGTPIPLVTDGSEWYNLKTPAYCWYNNDEETYKNTYGALYNWYTVNTGKLCPEGWHVPNIGELYGLESFLGFSVAGAKLKETGTSHWLSPNIGADNSSGFTALPGGYRSLQGRFIGLGLIGMWWCSTATPGSVGEPPEGYFKFIENKSSYFEWNFWANFPGLSVRCLKN